MEYYYAKMDLSRMSKKNIKLLAKYYNLFAESYNDLLWLIAITNIKEKHVTAQMFPSYPLPPTTISRIHHSTPHPPPRYMRNVKPPQSSKVAVPRIPHKKLRIEPPFEKGGPKTPSLGRESREKSSPPPIIKPQPRLARGWTEELARNPPIRPIPIRPPTPVVASRQSPPEPMDISTQYVKDEWRKLRI
jgi:hypothetical protein